MPFASASWLAAMINRQWFELTISRINFLGPKDIRAIEVRMYYVVTRLQPVILYSFNLYFYKCVVFTERIVKSVQFKVFTLNLTNHIESISKPDLNWWAWSEWQIYNHLSNLCKNNSYSFSTTLAHNKPKLQIVCHNLILSVSGERMCTILVNRWED